jgi:hypothetical protein
VRTTHRHLLFLVSLVAVAPIAAIAGVSGGGSWGPIGVGIGAVLVAFTAALSAQALRQQPRGFLQLRMLGLTVTVSVVAGLLALGALVVLIVRL